MTNDDFSPSSDPALRTPVRRPGDDTSTEPRRVPAAVRYRPDRRSVIERRRRRGDLVRMRRGRYRLGEHVHLCQRGKPRVRRTERQLRRHPITVPDRDRTLVDGRPVTTLERTLVDCARWLPAARALVVADSARRAGADTGVIRSVLDDAVGLPGVRQARRIAALADPRAESPGESLVRWHLEDIGIDVPRPDLAVEVATDRGTFWVDIGWEDVKVGIEFDGAVKYSGGEYGDPQGRLLAEKRRHDALTAAGWILLHVVWEDLADPERLVARVRAALAVARRRHSRPRPASTPAR